VSRGAYGDLSRALRLSDRGATGQAEELFRRALLEAADDPAVKGHFSLFLAARGRHEEALALSSEAKQKDGLYGLFHARVLLAAGNARAAVGALREFTKSYPKNLLGWGYLAVALLASGKSKEAVAVLSEHPLAGDPEMRARLLVEGESILGERGIEFEPKDLVVYAKKPRFFLNLRRQLQARACVSLGMKLLDQDEAEAAANVLRSALMLHPDQPVAGFYLGLALLQMKRPDEAADAFRSVPEKSRLASESKTCLGVALYYAGRHKEAVELLEGVDGNEVSHYFLGLSRLAMGEHGRAASEFSKALDLDPSIAMDRLTRLRDLLQKSNGRSG